LRPQRFLIDHLDCSRFELITDYFAFLRLPLFPNLFNRPSVHLQLNDIPPGVLQANPSTVSEDLFGFPYFFPSRVSSKPSKIFLPQRFPAILPSLLLTLLFLSPPPMMGLRGAWRFPGVSHWQPPSPFFSYPRKLKYKSSPLRNYCPPLDRAVLAPLA